MPGAMSDGSPGPDSDAAVKPELRLFLCRCSPCFAVGRTRRRAELRDENFCRSRRGNDRRSTADARPRLSRSPPRRSSAPQRTVFLSRPADCTRGQHGDVANLLSAYLDRPTSIAPASAAPSMSISRQWKSSAKVRSGPAIDLRTPQSIFEFHTRPVSVPRVGKRRQRVEEAVVLLGRRHRRVHLRDIAIVKRGVATAAAACSTDATSVGGTGEAVEIAHRHRTRALLHVGVAAERHQQRRAQTVDASGRPASVRSRSDRARAGTSSSAHASMAGVDSHRQSRPRRRPSGRDF